MPPTPASPPAPTPPADPPTTEAPATKAAPPTIRLRQRTFIEQCMSHGWYSASSQARALGLSPQSMWRTLEGQHGIGPTFIAACLRAFPDLGFDDFFEVVDGDVGPETMPARASEELSA